VDELQLDLGDGSVITVQRWAAVSLAQRLWDAGSDLSGAVSAAAEIQNALRTHSPYPERLTFGPREATALRAMLDPADAVGFGRHR
jgi:hypothetical protein